jgi:hypothetical protein
MDELPREAEKILAAAPEEFVAERKRVATELRLAGRTDEAAIVDRLRKPSAVVLAVNRAARDRPQAASAAADAAVRVREAQFGGDPGVYRSALQELEDSLDLLAEVALAVVAPRGRAPTEATRRRIRDLLRGAAAGDETREALGRGALTEEPDAVGFSPFAGMSPPAGKGKREASRGKSTQAKERAADLRKRKRALQDQLGRAEHALRDAERTARKAESERAKAEKAVASLREKLEQLEG